MPGFPQARQRAGGQARCALVRLIACLLALALGLAGCIRLAPRDQLAQALGEWLEQQQYSSWQHLHEPSGAGEARHPDGFTLGNHELFAAIGTEPGDLTGLTRLCGEGHTVCRINQVMPASLTLLVAGRERPLSAFASQRAQRIARSGVLVTEAEDGGLRVTVVDFAPLRPDLDALVRLVLVSNEGPVTLREAAVQLDLRGRSQGRLVRRTLVALDDGRLLVYGRVAVSLRRKGNEPGASFRSQRVSVIQPIGNLGGGQKRCAIFVLAALASADDEPALSRALRPHMADPIECLDRTVQGWRRWFDQAPLRCSDERLSDLLGSLLELIRSHQGPFAIHTGSLRYPHKRVYLRDSYWVQRALLEAGRFSEAKQNFSFLWRMWEQNGVASFYTLPERTGHGYGYQRVELPHYLVLMVRDMERWGGLDPAPYWPMVKGCLQQAAVDEGYQVMNGDETWLLAVPADELAYQLDNTWLLAASARYAADLARRMHDDAAERFARIAAQADQAVQAFLTERACQRGGNYWDRLPISGVIARGVMLEPERYPAWPRGADEERRLPLASWLEAAWRDLGFEEGIRATPPSTVFDGGTPGYVLYAASHLRLPFAPDLARGIRRLSAPMGNFWELHDSQDPTWGTEKRRLWDSAVVLAGLAHYLFGITPTAQGVIVDPNPPADGWAECSGYRIGQHRLGVRATPTGLTITWDRKTIVEADKPVGVVIRDGVVTQTFARAPATPSAVPPPSGWPAEIGRFVGSTKPDFVILHDNAPNYARRIGIEILRHKQFTVPIERLDRARLDAGGYGNAVIISKVIPPAEGRPYAVVHRGGATQVWVADRGNVWADTDPLLLDLLRFAPPRRERPMPFPDALLDLGQRFGRPPTQPARIHIAASLPIRFACGGQVEGPATTHDCRRPIQQMQAPREDLTPPFVLVAAKMPGSVTALEVLAESLKPASVTVTLTLPLTTLVASSRGAADWDRMADPVREYHDPDGSRRLVFRLYPGRGATRRKVTLTLTSLPTGER